MPDALLRQRFTAEDAAGATEAVHSAFGGGTVTAGRERLRFQQVSAVDDGVSVTRITSSGEDVVLETEASTELVVLSVREGRAEILDGSTVRSLGPGDLGLLAPGRVLRVRWSSVVLDAFSIGFSSLEGLLGVEGRRLRLRAPRLTPRSKDLALLWDRVARVLAGIVLEAPDLYERDLVRERMIDMLAATTIEAFELSDDAEAGVGRDDDALRRAETFMRGHLGEPLSVPDVARASGVSLRGLQLLYQRRLGTTPMLHLRTLRLEAARTDLERDEPDTTVGAVARRRGYSNLGRFSAHYRAAFDEAPSVTLQRARALED